MSKIQLMRPIGFLSVGRGRNARSLRGPGWRIQPPPAPLATISGSDGMPAAPRRSQTGGARARRALRHGPRPGPRAPARAARDGGAAGGLRAPRRAGAAPVPAPPRPQRRRRGRGPGGLPQALRARRELRRACALLDLAPPPDREPVPAPDGARAAAARAGAARGRGSDRRSQRLTRGAPEPYGSTRVARAPTRAPHARTPQRPRPARARAALLPGDRRRARRARGHGDVAPVARERAARAPGDDAPARGGAPRTEPDPGHAMKTSPTDAPECQRARE